MKKSILLILNIYKRAISPTMVALFGHACRYYPENLSCGDYAIKAINKYGIVKGGKQSIIRFVSCSPWSQSTRPEIVNVK